MLFVVFFLRPKTNKNYNNLYLPSAVFTPTKNSGAEKTTGNWPEANQLAIYKRRRGFGPATTVKQIHDRRADHTSTPPP